MRERDLVRLFVLPVSGRAVLALGVTLGLAGCGKRPEDVEAARVAEKAATEAKARVAGEANYQAIKAQAVKVQQAMASAPAVPTTTCPTLPGAGEIPVIGVERLAALAEGKATTPTTDVYAPSSWTHVRASIYGGLGAEQSRGREIYAEKLGRPEGAAAAAAKVVAVIRLDKVTPPVAGGVTGFDTKQGDRSTGSPTIEIEQHSFKGGRASGHVFLVDVDAGKVVCGDAVSGANESTFETSKTDLQRALEEDLAGYIRSSAKFRILDLAAGRPPISTLDP